MYSIIKWNAQTGGLLHLYEGEKGGEESPGVVNGTMTTRAREYLWPGAVSDINDIIEPPPALF